MSTRHRIDRDQLADDVVETVPVVVVQDDPGGTGAFFAGARVRVRQGDESAELDLVIDERLAPGAVGLPVATCPVSGLGAGGGEISLEVLS